MRFQTGEHVVLSCGALITVQCFRDTGYNHKMSAVSGFQKQSYSHVDGRGDSVRGRAVTDRDMAGSAAAVWVKEQQLLLSFLWKGNPLGPFRKAHQTQTFLSIASTSDYC